jgi:GT2 family glycosyltransferase
MPPSHAEVIVVDNASSDETRLGLYGYACQRPELRVVYNGENRGFAAANNQGLNLASGELLVLLNNDTLVTPGWTRKLARWLEDPAIGLVGPVTNWVGNEALVEADYEDLAGLNRFAAWRGRTHAGRGFDIGVLAMYCVAMRRDVFKRVGGLDERFEVGMFEDDDYARRVRAQGLRVVCAEDTFIHHFGNASFGTLDRAEYQALFGRNRARFEQKWGETWSPHRLRGAEPGA